MRSQRRGVKIGRPNSTGDRRCINTTSEKKAKQKTKSSLELAQANDISSPAVIVASEESSAIGEQKPLSPLEGRTQKKRAAP